VEESTCFGVDARHKPFMMIKRRRRRRRRRLEKRGEDFETRVYIYALDYLSNEFLYSLCICVKFHWKFVFV
jgi:hypothetical protein